MPSLWARVLFDYVAYACDCVCYCVRISGMKFYLEGKNVKLRKNLIFLKNGKNSKIAEMVQGNLENFLDLG